MVRGYNRSYRNELRASLVTEMSSEQKKQRYIESGCVHPQEQYHTETESKLSIFQCVQDSGQDQQLQTVAKMFQISGQGIQLSGKVFAHCIHANLWALSPTRVGRIFKALNTESTQTVTLYFYQDIGFVGESHMFSYSPIIAIKGWQACVL